MSRLDDGVEKFGVVGTFALLIYVLVFLPLWKLGVFEWKLFYSSAQLVNEQVELCVADRNTEMQLLEPSHRMQEMYGFNEAAIVKRLITDEIMKELEISEAGFNALSSTEQNRLIETWDNRPFWWQKNPEINFTEELKEGSRKAREFKIRLRSETANSLAGIVANEIAENEDIKEANQSRIEANKQARKEDAVWNGLSKEKRIAICLPEINRRTRELYFFSRVDRYLNSFKEDVAAIQVAD